MATVAFTTRANLVGGQPENIADVTDCLDKLLAGVNTVDTAQIGSLAVTDAKVAAATITDTKLASPSNAVWRPILSVAAGVSGAAAGTYYQAQGNGAPSGSALTASSALPIFIPSTTDYEVAGKTTRLRLAVTIATNATAPGVNVTYGLYTVSALAGGANAITLTLGASVMTVAFATPAAGTAYRSLSTSVDLSTLSSSALYVFVVVTAGAMAANATVMNSSVLEMRHT